jgi:hypothetical protein
MIFASACFSDCRERSASGYYDSGLSDFPPFCDLNAIRGYRPRRPRDSLEANGYK